LIFYNRVVKNLSIIEPHAIDSKGLIFYPDKEGNLYVRNESFNFVFYVNKRASCEYRIGSSLMNSLLALLLNYDYSTVPNSDNKWYKYNMNIPKSSIENGDTLTIICNDYDYGGDSNIRKDYKIYFVNPNDLRVNIIKKEVSS